MPVTTHKILQQTIKPTIIYTLAVNTKEKMLPRQRLKNTNAAKTKNAKKIQHSVKTWLAAKMKQERKKKSHVAKCKSKICYDEKITFYTLGFFSRKISIADNKSYVAGKRPHLQHVQQRH